MWQEGWIQIPFLHTSWSRGQRLGCRPWPRWIISREGASVIPSRSGWYHPNRWPYHTTWLLLLCTEPQPGSYPGGEQLTSRNTTYAELQDSLVTQEKEDLILQGRVETSMYTETPSTEEYWKMPPPPPPKKGKPGYEAYMNRMATEEQKYH